MAIKISKKDLQQIVREEYFRSINEEASSEMSREGVEKMRKIAFEIAQKLSREVDTASMANQVDKQRLFAAIIDQAKLSMKE